jgi:hypothetical protein
MHVLFSTIFVVFLTATTFAQTSTEPASEPPPETRAEALRRERESKAGSTVPNKYDGLQRTLNIAEETAARLFVRDGLHPKIGSLTTGSGIAYGLGYRSRAPFAGRVILDTFGAASFSKYWAIETRAIFPNVAGGRIVAQAIGSLREYPEETFYGLGPDSSTGNEGSFLLRTARVGASAGVSPLRYTTIGGGLDYLTPRVRRGRDDESIHDVFPRRDLPGVEAGTDYVRTTVFAEFDYRVPRNARQGGYYRVDRSHYSDRTSGAYSFNRTDVDLRQYFGFFNGRRVIALRGLLSTTDGDDGAVPFYLMPYLGGKDTLRGYRDYRFRAPHAMLLQAEYRWEIWSALEGALFYDTGKVANVRSDLSFKNLESAYGFGFRFNTDEAVVMRFDAAFGSRDGKRLHISLGGFF